MAVNWQTGEPPCGVALVIEYKFRGWPQAYKRIGMKLPSGNWRLDGHSGEQSDVEISRWSTLDDDRAAMAMGAMEKLARTCKSDKHIEIGGDDTRVVIGVYRLRDGMPLAETVEAPSLIEAIEKLTEAGNGLQGD